MWKRTEAEARAGVMKKESPGAGAGAMFMKRIAPDAELCLRMSFLRRLRGPGFNTQRHLMWEPLSCWVRRSSRMRTTFLWLVVVTRAVEPKLKFQAPAPGIYIFWLLLQYIEASGSSYRTFRSIENSKRLYYLYNSPAQQTTSAEPEPKFQAPAPASKSFWLRLQPSTFCLGSGSTALIVTNEFCLVDHSVLTFVTNIVHRFPARGKAG